MKIFCDTSFFIAFYDANDQYHQSAVLLLQKLAKEKNILFTSDYVIDETLTFLLLTHPDYGYKRAKLFDADILNKKVENILIDELLFNKAREIFFKYNLDKKWSFTDCTSFAVIDDFGFSKALTFDEHFKQKGISII